MNDIKVLARFIPGVLLLLGILIALTPIIIFPVCELQGFDRMSCSYMGLFEAVTGLLIIILGVLLLVKGRTITFATRLVGLLLFISGLLVVMIPEFTGYCHSSRMPCNYGTVPSLRLEGIVLSLLSLSWIIFSFRKEQG